MIVGITISLLIVAAAVYLAPRLLTARIPMVRQTGKTFLAIVGESHNQSALRKIAKSGEHGGLGLQVQAVLVPEHSNPYDENAVRVEIHRKTVGYLSRDEAAKFRKRLAAANMPLRTYRCHAAILGGGRKNYGVWIDLPDRLKPDQ